MKIAIPLEGGKISFYFGRCLQFGFFEIENNKVLSKEIVDAPNLSKRHFLLCSKLS